MEGINIFLKKRKTKIDTMVVNNVKAFPKVEG